jgi:glycopeptide antibiotics resistance protein
MNVYLFDIKLAILSFIGVSWHIAIIYMLLQYRKHGAISKIRTIIHASFFFYMLSAYYLIILPLPDPSTMTPVEDITQHMNLIPFKFVHDFIHGTTLNITKIHTFLPALMESVFFQPFFNVVLTIPFGIYLSYYFKQNFKKTVLLTFLLSLFFELTQLTALYGIYPSPYRLFDVDDLMTNTLGGLIGFVIYKHFLFFLPSKEKMDAESLNRSEKVGYIRRATAFFVDYHIVLLISTAITNLVEISEIFDLIVLVLVLYAYFTLSQILFKQTLGKAMVNIKLQSETEKQNYMISVLIRYAILVLIIFGFGLLDLLVKNTYANGKYAIMYLCLLVLMFVDFLINVKHGKMLFYEKISKMRNVSTKRKTDSESIH